MIKSSVKSSQDRSICFHMRESTEGIPECVNQVTKSTELKLIQPNDISDKHLSTINLPAQTLDHQRKNCRFCHFKRTLTLSFCTCTIRTKPGTVSMNGCFREGPAGLSAASKTLPGSNTFSGCLQCIRKTKTTK